MKDRMYECDGIKGYQLESNEIEKETIFFWSDVDHERGGGRMWIDMV